MFKSEKGITLVALVITIIVLLILAGITLMLALGNNGILGQASKGRMTQIEAEVKEQMQLAILSAKTEMLAQTARNSSKVFTQAEVAGYIMDALDSSKYAVTVNGNTPVADDTSTADVMEGALTTSWTTFTITYNGQEYKTATDTSTAIITRTCKAKTYTLEDQDDTTSNVASRGTI